MAASADSLIKQPDAITRRFPAPSNYFAIIFVNKFITLQAPGRHSARPRLSTRMLHRAYDWCVAAADKPYALWLLGAISFAESSFFPIPPDIMLIPMALAHPKRAYTYALLCTITSVAGGVLGYAIGALLYDSVGVVGLVVGRFRAGPVALAA